VVLWLVLKLLVDYQNIPTFMSNFYQSMTTIELEARLDNLLSTAQAETADIDLFSPIIVTEREECPICMIPLPINETQTLFKACCGKTICNGCAIKHMLTDKDKKGASHSWDDYKCPFCQQPKTGNIIKSLKKLMKKNNPGAFMQMAKGYKNGEGVFQSDSKSVEMHIRAGEIGHANAFDHIGCAYDNGIAVKQDKSKALEFYEVGAKKGSVSAHEHLTDLQGERGNFDESIKHCRVAASAGDQDSLDKFMSLYKKEFVTKEDLTQTLRAFQTAKNAMKSKDRDEAKVYFDRYKNRR